MFSINKDDFLTFQNSTSYYNVNMKERVNIEDALNPCSTTLFTIWKETRSLKWTIVSALMPLAFGFIICTMAAGLWHMFQIS